MALATAVTAAFALAGPHSAGAAGVSAARQPEPAPLIHAADPVPGQYIVTLDPLVDPAAAARKLGVKPDFLYSKVLNGFAVPLTPIELRLIRQAPGVTSVEEDAKVSASGSMTAAVPPRTAALPSRTAAAPPRTTLGPASTWGLDRVDQRKLPLDGTFTTAGDGAGVNAYILDTGIDYGHSEFGGRATFGFDAVGDGRRGADCNGHGTHVAGTVGGTTYGVARKANLVSVRVLNCEGQGENSGVIAGLDWVARNAVQPAVLNGSVGGDKSTALNQVTNALHDRGVLPVLAAGNSAKDACGVSPASAPKAVTVGASDRRDAQADFSNWGTCVDLYAPGEDILSAKLGGGSVTLDGTSMAAPHVAGVAVLYKEAHPTAAPAEVAGFLETASTKDVLSKLGKGSPDALLFTDNL
ncbi:S8 family peptidase [Streptomyces liangshanensis]|uniref:S8 family peptidase n=1 Tax=Streptomyces liangshanensis TaxID=2717324 RepID=A0A6G9H9L1_9ACTN|nr:S8 family peptidase [Streptomyces liangshanensis]